MLFAVEASTLTWIGAPASVLVLVMVLASEANSNVVV